MSTLSARWMLMCAGALALACACSKKERPAQVLEPASLSAITVAVDSVPLTKLDIRNISERVALLDLLPAERPDPTSWKVLSAEGAKGATIKLLDPSTTYARHHIDLFRHANGQIALGVFREIPAGIAPELAKQLGEPKVLLLGVSSIALHTQVADAPLVPPLPVRVDGTPETALEKETITGEVAHKPSTRRGAMDLASIASRYCQGPGTVTLETLGEGLIELAPDGSGATVKLNQKGIWRASVPSTETIEAQRYDLAGLQIHCN